MTLAVYQARCLGPRVPSGFYLASTLLPKVVQTHARSEILLHGDARCPARWNSLSQLETGKCNKPTTNPGTKRLIINMNARQNRCSMPSAGRTADTVNVRMAGLLFLMLIYPLAVHGLGFRIPNLDAESTAKGNAVIATADNPSALYYNPAGITQI